MSYKVLLFLTLLFTSTLITAQVKREKIVYGDDKKVEIKSEDSNNSDTKRFYLSLALGGNIGVAGSTTFPSPVNFYGNIDNFNYNSESISYGSGFSVQAGLGYQINQNLGLEVNFDYQYGAASTISDSYSGLDTIQNTPLIINTNIDFKYSSNIFKIQPQVVISLPIKNIIPYFKIGPVFGYSNRSEKQSYNATIGTFGKDNIELEYMDISGVGYGLTSNFGIKFPISDNSCYFFTDMNLTLLNQTYESGSLITATENNNSFLSTLNTNTKQYTYSNSVNQNIWSRSPNLPDVKPMEFFNFNSIGFKIGLIFIL